MPNETEQTVFDEISDEEEETVFHESSDEEDPDYVLERVRKKKKETWLDSDSEDDSDTEIDHFPSTSGKTLFTLYSEFILLFLNFCFNLIPYSLQRFPLKGCTMMQWRDA